MTETTQCAKLRSAADGLLELNLKETVLVAACTQL